MPRVNLKIFRQCTGVLARGYALSLTVSRVAAHHGVLNDELERVGNSKEGNDIKYDCLDLLCSYVPL